MKDYKKVMCEECKKEFYRITNTHLWKEHQMTIDEYKQKYPKSLIEDELLALDRAKHLRGKTYEEIYGDRAEEERKKHSDATKKQMQDEWQIKTRKQTCGYTPTKEQKKMNSESHMIHGGSNYRERALEFYGEECMRCGTTKNLVVHHKSFLNINSIYGNHDIKDLMVLCRSCHAKLHNEYKPGKFTGIDLVEKGAIYMLKGLEKQFGLNLKDKNFLDTPKRIARAYYEIFEGINCQDEICNIAETSFPSEYDGMVIADNIRVFSMCPHHFLPVEYIVNVGYIPNKKTVGISKLSRVVELLAKQPELQEMFTAKVANILEKELQPKGVIVQVKGRHFCMVMRGVKKDSWTMTSSIKGVFDEQKVREEFMLLVNKNG